MGLSGFATLSLPGLLRLQSAIASDQSSKPRERKSIIMVWKPGGCSHIDTYDPKPEAPIDYRGPFQTIATKVPGLHFTELLPRQAALADHLVVVRSMSQTAGGHPAGSMQMLSGDMDTLDKPKPRLPDWMCAANRLLAERVGRSNPLPRSVGINPPLTYSGPAWLGDSWRPFVVSGDP
ncbi:MAG: DUF1501 domain-containing protein, partial [Pirellula sp.]